jgi:hypothetical protein
MGLENRIPCKTCGCEVYKDEMKSKENGEYSCCVWYMDNCILEGIPVNDCPTYKKNIKKGVRI